MSTCQCIPAVKDGLPYIQWIGSWFADCLYSNYDIAAFVFGGFSFVCSAVALLPQIVLDLIQWLNYKRKSVTGLSLGLILLWSFGDLANLLGTIFIRQLSTQKITAVLFIASDILMLAQYYSYYGNAYMPIDEVTEAEIADISGNSLALPSNALIVALACTSVVSAASINVVFSPICDEPIALTEREIMIGYVLAWCSASLYFFSR